LDNKAFDAVP